MNGGASDSGAGAGPAELSTPAITMLESAAKLIGIATGMWTLELAFDEEGRLIVERTFAHRVVRNEELVGARRPGDLSPDAIAMLEGAAAMIDVDEASLEVRFEDGRLVRNYAHYGPLRREGLEPLFQEQQQP